MAWPLVLAALALGVASLPHCALMCGAPCAALTQGCGRSVAVFQIGRLLGYMAGGALAAASISALGAWSQAAPALRPLWTLLHLALLMLGLFWLVAARQPAWLRRDGWQPLRFAASRGRTLRAGAAGLAWVAWPCAALQGALMLAALASSAPGGALVMAAFAVASMPGSAAAPWALRRWRAWRGEAAAPASSAGQIAATGLRIAGAALAGVSAAALAHGIWPRIAAWCGAG